MKHIFILSTLISTLAVPGIAQQQPRPAKVFTVAEQSAEVVRRYPAIVLPSQEVELSFRISGNLVALPIRGSLEVNTGDVIAQLDTRDWERQAAQLQSQIDQATANLTALRAGARPQEISALEAGVEAAEAELDRIRDQVERSRQLIQRGTISGATLDQDEAALRVAEASLRTRREELAIGRAGGRPEEIAAAEASIRGIESQLQAVRDNIDDSTLRAPFAGIIARRDVENFANVQAGQSIALLQAQSVIHLSFDVPATDVNVLTAAGPEAIRNFAQVDALPGQTIEAETVEFSVQADNATQTYHGRVAMDVPAGAFILPGMVGTVISTAPGPVPVLTIPLTGVAATSDGAPQVWIVAEDGEVNPRAVTLGEVRGAMVVVSEGLNAGDTIVSAGVSALLPGMVIRPVSKIGG